MPRWMFETRTEAWHEAGLADEITHTSSAPKAIAQTLIFGLLFAAVLVAFDNRQEFVSADQTVLRVITAILLTIFGWALARSIGNGLIPALLRRMDPATAGSAGFLIRLVMSGAVVVIALRIAGIRAETLAVGGVFTAVIIGLAAQQTLGNIFAGIVLQGTRPFRVGERISMSGGFLGDNLEGTVSSLGLFYTAFINGSDRVIVPNSVLLQVSVTPVREPERVDIRARINASISPATMQARLREGITVPIRYSPQVKVEEITQDEVIFRIVAVPFRPSDGAQLTEEILSVTRRRFEELREMAEANREAAN